MMLSTRTILSHSVKYAGGTDLIKVVGRGRGRSPGGRYQRGEINEILTSGGFTSGDGLEKVIGIFEDTQRLSGLHQPHDTVYKVM